MPIIPFEGRAPRIHPTAFIAPTAVVIGDVRLPADVRAALRERFDYAEARVQTMPMKFACPSAVARMAGSNSGATEIAQPWADAVTY
jgi:gamma-glutamyltranspeptidase/glutathione hydrolase